MDNYKAYLYCPFYQSIIGQCGSNVMRASADLNRFFPSYGGDAFLARNFNAGWCSALNTRQKYKWTHFCMIHADVLPYLDCWLDVLVLEMERTGADLLSVVLPIKSPHGVTSTAVEDESGKIRMLTMKEVDAVKKVTFDAEDAGFPGCKLLCSTGLWLADFTRPWVEDVWFEVRDRIVKRPDGVFERDTLPEDWHFSRLLHKQGLRPLSTKIIPCGHFGMHEWPNTGPWGTMGESPWHGPFDWTP